MPSTILTVVIQNRKLTARQMKAIRRKVECALAGKSSADVSGQSGDVCVNTPVVSYCHTVVPNTVETSTGTATGGK